MIKYHKNPFNTKQAFKCAIISSFIINIILMMGILYPNSSDVLRFLDVNGIRLGTLFTAQFISNVILFFLLFLFNFRLVKKGRESRKDGFIFLGGTLLITIFVSIILSTGEWFILIEKQINGLDEFRLFNLLKDLLSSFVIALITATITLGYKREQMQITNQQLIIENIKTKYEALKNQLDPHFLFNSLNTLNGLIGEDDNKAHEFVDSLSSVFRYTIHNKNVVKLQDEIEFVDDYFAMLQIRFGDNIEIFYDIDKQYLSYYIMPVSLQLLVENAVKHNVISDKKKLVIQIATTQDGNVNVVNYINPKSERGMAGIGLANLSERYKLLFNKDIEISELSGFFKVEIPLLKEIDKRLQL